MATMKRSISRKGAKPQRKPLSEFLALFAFCLLLTAYCLLPSAFSSLAQVFPAQSEPTPAPRPLPSPSPSPTPPPNLHQWGAVTLFHGLPSDRVHAIAQTADGVLWFATDGGLAKYDGRRTQAVTAEDCRRAACWR